MVPDGPSPEDGPGRSRWARLRCPVSVANVSVLFALACVLFPAVANCTFFVYRLVFGTLYPAYASYKAVRSRDVREYVKWMMYWIVFALFTCGETITDVFLSFWFPFYYEIKIGFVLWLLSPATKGSSILYRKFVHPMLTNREQEIDEYIARAKEQGYHTVLHLGSKGVNYATNVIMQTAIKGGGGLVNQLRKSYSLSDLTDGDGEPVRDINRNGKDVDGLEYRGNRRPDRVDGARPANRARGYSPRRSASGSARMEMYFPEVDVDVRQRRGSSRSREASVPLSHIRSSEDVSSGYNSGDHFYEDASQMDIDQASEDSAPLATAEGPLVRTASVGSTRSTRTKGSTSTRASTTSSTSTASKKATQGETDEDGSNSDDEDIWSDPMDHISPLLDRTIFANDLNTFPNSQPTLAVEFISSSAEVGQTSAGLVVNANLSSILIDKRTNLRDEELLRLIPVGVDAQLSESSGSKHTDVSEVDHSTSDNDSFRNSDPNSSEDASSSDTLTLCDISISQSLSELVSEETKVVADDLDSKLLSEKQDAAKDIIAPSPADTANSIATAKENITAETEGKSCEDSSSGDGTGMQSKKNFEELRATNAKTLETSEPEKSTNSTIIQKAEVSKSSKAPVDVSLSGENQQVVGKDPPSTVASSHKDNVDSRGGKYNKRPAPEPPQDEDTVSGPSMEPELSHHDALHARLVLKRGIVRSLPDVGSASAREVFIPVRPSRRASPSPSSRSNSPKVFGGVGDVGLKNKSSNSGSSSPRFLNLPGGPHFGSLTSLFPFWHSGTSAESSSFFTSKKLGESKGGSGKIDKSRSKVERKGSDVHEKPVPEAKSKEKYGSGSGSSSGSREGEKEKKDFKIRKLSHSPSRSHSFRKFFN